MSVEAYLSKFSDLRRRLSESAGFELVPTPRTDFHRAVEFIETDETIAFGDATIAAYMDRTGIEYLYAFDEDFDSLREFTRLASADNPFAG